MTSNSCGLFSTADPVPQGSGVSSGGHTYITQEDASFSHGSCQSKSIDIVAQSPGVDYNTSSSASFTVAGRPDVTGSGSASGGTDNVVTVVSQADIDGAKAKFTAPSKSDAQSALSTQLQKDGLMPIDTSFNASDQNIATSAKVGDQVSSFTATSTINYSMLGVNKANLKTYLDDQIKGQINTGQQTIQDDGLSQATFSVVGTGDSPKVTIQTSATIGPNLDTDAIKRDIAGKKKGDTISIIEQRPSIKGVTVNYSPFWVTKTPSKASKVIITFQKADGK